MWAFWIFRAWIIAFFLGLSERMIFTASIGKVEGSIAVRWEDEGMAIICGGSVIVKMSGIGFFLVVIIFIAGRDMKSGIILSFSLIWDISKEYCENYVANLSS